MPYRPPGQFVHVHEQTPLEQLDELLQPEGQPPDGQQPYSPTVQLLGCANDSATPAARQSELEEI